MVIPSRAELLRKLDQERTARLRVLQALPSLDTILIDPDLVTAPDLTGLCYAYFEGHARNKPCALLAIALDPTVLPVARWREEAPPSPPRLDTAIGAALAETTKRLGRSRDLGLRLAMELRKLGIDRHPRTFLRDRPLSPTAEEERVAEALARCLAHLHDPQPLDALPAFVYPLPGANLAQSSRTPPGYAGGHEHHLRLAA